MKPHVESGVDGFLSHGMLLTVTTGPPKQAAERVAGAPAGDALAKSKHANEMSRLLVKLSV